MSEEKRLHWRKLDNAAKIFPATSGHRDTRVFRFYCELKEAVDGDSLQKALDMALKKCPVFLSVMRKGLFWYYLEKSDLHPLVKEEEDPPCLDLYIRDRRSLLFQVNYYKNRINFEVYHALTDGTGAIQFLKELVKDYLQIKHPEAQPPDIPFMPEGTTMRDLENDSFSKYYKKPAREAKKSPKRKPCCITGTKAGYGNLNVTEAVVSSSALRRKAKEYHVSVTVFLTAVFLCAIHEEMSGPKRQGDVVLMVPVNLRNYFPSSSILNFFGWIEPGYHFQDSKYDFEDILSTVKQYFQEELTPERLCRHMSVFMALERNPILRLAPLELKNPIMQLANQLAGKDLTAILSNLGVISMPEEYAEYIKRFGVFISTPKLQLCICSYEDDLVFSFSSAFQEHNIERNFFRILKNFGLEARVMEERFPKKKEPSGRGSLFLKWFSFSCIAVSVLAMAADMIFTSRLYWSVFVSGAVLSMWIVCTIGFLKRHNLLKNGIWQLILLSTACILWDYFTGFQGWSLDFAFPAICLSTIIFFQIIVRFQKLTVPDYMIYYLLAAFFGLIPFLLMAAGMIHIIYPSVICAGISFLFLAGLFIFRKKEILSELRKKLHF